MGRIWRDRTILIRREGTGLIGQLMGLIRLSASFAAQLFYRPTDAIAEEYHKWHYGTLLWTKTTWMGVKCWKSVSDMWNYQEILIELKPSLVIEFGTRYGGSALFFANVMRYAGQPFKVLSVDISHTTLDPLARREPDILFIESSSTDPAIAERIQRLKGEYPGKIFAILDSDHSMNHVLAEMKLLRPLFSAGDYLVVEDSGATQAVAQRASRHPAKVAAPPTIPPRDRVQPGRKRVQQAAHESDAPRRFQGVLPIGYARSRPLRGCR